jgi:ATP-binding cassette, subfamily A (ABC1), member 3
LRQVGSTYGDVSEIDGITTALTFALNLFFPIGNIFRACILGLNVSEVACSGGTVYPPHSIYAYGGPILYLVIQCFVFLGILIWLEKARALPRFTKRSGAAERDVDSEKSAAYVSEEVQKEKSRVETSETDLLRVLNLTKSFGDNVAVDNVTLGLGESDVMALIGPNGAGKSTLVNLIRADLYPDSGKVYLRGEDAYSASAQKYLGGKPPYTSFIRNIPNVYLSSLPAIRRPGSPRHQGASPVLRQNQGHQGRQA